MKIEIKRMDIIECFLKKGMNKTLVNYKYVLPHANLFEEIINHHELRKNGEIWKTDLEHIEDVVKAMDNLLKKELDKLIDTPEYGNLERIINPLNDDDKYFLLFAALYHDIGKAIIKPRHGPEGADIIKDSKLEQRELFYKLGFKRPHFFLMSNLLRFHDYLAMVGTGEVSYLIFAEVLCPVSNISLSETSCPDKFLDYLLLLNLADMAGSIGKINSEDFAVLMHDFGEIKRIHEYISKKVYKDMHKEPLISEMSKVHKVAIPVRNHINILPELQRLAENHTTERLRRLLRIGFKDLIKQDKKIDGLSEYKKWIKLEYGQEFKEYQILPENWFSRDYEHEYDDSVPIIASLRGINVNQKFYTGFAFICKLDYMLSFMRELFKKAIEIEIDKELDERKSPHDLRCDLAMTLVELINTLVELFGPFTLNNTKIGLGFERFKEMNEDQRDKMLIRLTGKDGDFKEAEAFTKLRNMVILWVIIP